MQLPLSLFNIKSKLISSYLLIPKRVKFAAASVLQGILAVLFVMLWSGGLNFKVSLLFSTVSFFILVFVLLYGLTFKNVFKVIPVPAVFVLSTFYILNFFPNLQLLFKLIFIIFSSFIYYFLLLSINVFIVVEEKGSSIPLLRAAKTTFLMVEIIALFLFFTSVYKIILPDPLTELTFIFRSIIVALTGYFFAQEYWWSQNLEQEVTNFVGNESITIGFVLLSVSLALSFYGTESFFRSLALNTSYYISLVFFQSIVTHKLKRTQYLEYIILVVIVLLFLLIA